MDDWWIDFSNPDLEVLSSIWGELDVLYTRLQPHMRRYRSMLSRVSATVYSTPSRQSGCWCCTNDSFSQSSVPLTASTCLTLWRRWRTVSPTYTMPSATCPAICSPAHRDNWQPLPLPLRPRQRSYSRRYLSPFLSGYLFSLLYHRIVSLSRPHGSVRIGDLSACVPVISDAD